MSQRFTVSKSEGERRASDIQGEVNQLFEGDEPPSTSATVADETAAGTEVVVVLQGTTISLSNRFTPLPLPMLFVSYRLYASNQHTVYGQMCVT